ncbi:hypothetical protein [Phenylobacterium sp.]|uniref:hypothetical protein n=1 Tax=Phenylobacterium sp. TaxID=1871053 RepID=UPI0030F3A265
MKVLSAPTCLYHPTLAPAGQVFAAGERHPGAGWSDSPAAFEATSGPAAFIARLQLALEDSQAEVQRQLVDRDAAQARIVELEGELAKRLATRRKPKS